LHGPCQAEQQPLRLPRTPVLTRFCSEFKRIAETRLSARPSRQSQSFDSESAERRPSAQMRSIYAKLLGYADGIEFAISDAVDIFISERKILPIGVAIPFLKCGGASFEE
jgi:hypothetical protein